MRRYVLPLITILIGINIYLIFIAPTPPKLQLKYWGPGNEKPDDLTIRPFKIKFSESDIKLLKEKVISAEITESVTDSLKLRRIAHYMHDLQKFWTTEYNWTEREAYMNQFPQFITEIGGLDLHFVQIKPDPSQSKGKKVLPLLVLHGWPAIPSEIFQLTSLLTTPHPEVDFMFEIVIPSLPGFGFSEAPSKSGLNAAEISLIMDELMKRLGYTSYFIHGDGWGSVIGSAQAILHPDRVLGLHSTMCLPLTMKSIVYVSLCKTFPKTFVEKSMRKLFSEQFSHYHDSLTHFYNVETRSPVLLGRILSDSPTTFATHVLEKMLSPAKIHAKILEEELNINKTRFLDTISVMWLTKSITSSLRIYAENTIQGYYATGVHKFPVTVPSACVFFKNDAGFVPRFAVKATYTNLLLYAIYPIGGHYATVDETKHLSDGIWNFVKIARSKNLKTKSTN